MQINNLIRSLVLICIFVPSTISYAGKQQPADDNIRSLLTEAINDASSFDDRFDAEVWLLDNSNRLIRFIPDDKERLHLLKLIHAEATRAKIQPEIILALIEVESHFDQYAISHAGAIGLMQVMPFWLDEIGRPNDNLFDAQTNLRFGCTILRYYLDKEKGNLTHALARYNGSLHSYKYTNKIYRALDNHWQ